MKEKIIQAPNIFGIAKDYVGKWIALSADYKKVLASGETLEEVMEKTSFYKRKMVFRHFPKFPYIPTRFLVRP